MHPADPLGSLTPAEAPLIEAEKLSEQAGPPHSLPCPNIAEMRAGEEDGMFSEIPT
jgi:hypothetical protein